MRMILTRRAGRLSFKLAALMATLFISYLIGTGNWKANSSSKTLNFTQLGYDDENRPEKACNCQAILKGDREALAEAKLLNLGKTFRKQVQVPDQFYVNASKDCMKYRTSRKYLTFPLSQEEEDFPIAYSIVLHHKMQSFERLLRTIYAPQNVYCIHVDRKAAPSFFAAVSSVASCFPNVFLVSRREYMIYNGWSRVQADLNCMAELNASSVPWKYFLNLCGQDFPLKTNLEIVRALRALDGRNSLGSIPMPWDKKWRTEKVFKVVKGKWNTNGTKKTGQPPFKLFSGNAYIIVTRGFIQSVLEDRRIQVLLEWAKDTFDAEEMVWATIQRIPGVHGSTWPHSKYDIGDQHAIARLVKWAWHEGNPTSKNAAYPPCQGVHVRGVCVYGAGDLQWLLTHRHLFANKFDINTDPIAIYCLEKYLRQKVLDQLREMNGEYGWELPGTSQ
ncbi:beta-1,3-galactosyl-O-glycosyl-glycoprotein beta-1,6-N-acetylglucosaminyltransferase-like [Corythoichthys intestinalis]|uniref:beta-1,3-galactosyl-O-glycosyl-glycoprotein beta-1,6-N-acetylglucosaminyltransferase-like n=1 Tax=Corythoichthys intestinalis TaxID=161448 RepID=UPI0025A65B23|nr:beta-1,3-galactosyl-O-glycosyl-glycoprotein beta-1,6-N-acetylglucosaminyltransferase-like [Corythoichthys intestinalis]XP_061802142.1 beta-1,3-galactosyl-O-glycosyl-glycoprotein beta-1,6-N-acetylglucosaminyltransferase-like [Nerophis lumbriciformis]